MGNLVYIAALSGTELGALLVPIFGAFGTILYGFYRYANAREEEFAKDRKTQSESFDKSIEKLTKSLDKNSKASAEVAKATKQAAKEAKERNGHLAEMSMENKNQIIDAISRVKKQEVTTQVVSHQEVKE